MNSLVKIKKGVVTHEQQLPCMIHVWLRGLFRATIIHHLIATSTLYESNIICVINSLSIKKSKNITYDQGPARTHVKTCANSYNVALRVPFFNERWQESLYLAHYTIA